MYFRELCIVQNIFYNVEFVDTELVTVSILGRLGGVNIFPRAAGGFGTEKSIFTPAEMHTASRPVSCWQIWVFSPLVLRS